MDHIYLVLLGAFCGVLLGFFAACLMAMSRCGDCREARMKECDKMRFWL